MSPKHENPRLSPTLLTTDAEFLAAEREIAELRTKREALSPGIKTLADEERLRKPLSDRLWALYDQITLSPPVSLTSVAVKLRLLADPDLGLENNEGENDIASLRQVLGLVERVAGSDDAIKDAYVTVTSMENDLEEARILADGVAILAVDSIHDERLGAVLMRLAWGIADHCKAMEERRGELFQLLHPNREGWPGADAGEAQP
jgi:hypothetical protein